MIPADLAGSPRTCFEAQIAGVLSEWDIDYRWTAVESWGFGYRSRSWDHYSSVGERLTAGTGDPRKLLRHYCGVSFGEQVFTDFSGAVETVAAALTTGHGVIVSTDSYWCPWDPGYHMHHQSHFIVVRNVDKEKEELVCDDHFFGKRSVSYPFHLWSRALRSGVTLRRESRRPPAPAEIPAILVRNFAAEGAASLEQMALFAEDIGAGIDLDVELDGYHQNWWAAPLFRKLRKVAAGRELAAGALVELAGEYDLATEFGELGRDWNTVRMLVLKSGKARSPAPIAERAALLIQQLCAREAALSERMSEGADLPSDTCAVVDLPLRMDGLVNRRGFGCSHEPGQFDDEGRYLRVEDAPGSRIVTVRGWRFELAPLHPDRGDHIEAVGQSLTVPAANFDEVGLLVLAETALTTEMTFVYADRSTTIAPCTLPSWREISDAPLLIDVARAGDGVDALGFDVGGMRQISFPIDSRATLTGIRLPLDAALRIFAVTVRRELR